MQAAAFRSIAFDRLKYAPRAIFPLACLAIVFGWLTTRPQHSRPVARASAQTVAPTFHASATDTIPPAESQSSPEIAQMSAWTEPRMTGDVRLTNTILGIVRRAAVINGRIYPEGSTVIIRGERLRLAAVHSNRIELRPEDQTTGSSRIVALEDTSATDRAITRTAERDGQ